MRYKAIDVSIRDISHSRWNPCTTQVACVTFAYNVCIECAITMYDATADIPTKQTLISHIINVVFVYKIHKKNAAKI